MNRQQRVEIANDFLRIISQHGRRFFHFQGRVSRFELDERRRVWFIDSYRQSRIYTHREGSWGRKFHNGGTLLSLCKALRDFIMDRGSLPLRHLGPWPQTLCEGDLWGYGDEMATVREQCSALIPADDQEDIIAFITEVQILEAANRELSVKLERLDRESNDRRAISVESHRLQGLAEAGNRELSAEVERLKAQVALAQADLKSGLSYGQGHEKERQWMEEAARTLATPAEEKGT